MNTRFSAWITVDEWVQALACTPSACARNHNTQVSVKIRQIYLLIPYCINLSWSKGYVCRLLWTHQGASFIPSPNLLYWNEISRFSFWPILLVELRLSATSGDEKEGKQEHLTLSPEGFPVSWSILQLYPPTPLPRTGSQPVSLTRTRSASDIAPFCFFCCKKKRLWWDWVCLHPNFTIPGGPKDREL